MGGCLATDWISFTRERVYRCLLRNGVCLSADRIVRFEVSAGQWVYTPQYTKRKRLQQQYLEVTAQAIKTSVKH
jgi:hypothetical protein